MAHRIVRLGMIMGPVLLATACASQNGAHPDDPLYGWNKSMFAVNTAVDKAVIKPSARRYRAVVPRPGRDGVRNVLNNLKSPLIFGSDVLQGQPGRAGQTLARFVINSTVGLVGIFDIAKRQGIPRHDEDMGQTLGVWGIHAGPYVVLPILGPSNFRDMTGLIMDIAFDPLTYMRYKGRTLTYLGRAGVDGLSVREANLETVDTLRNTSIDEYTSEKTAYAQFRNNAIANGKIDMNALPDFDDEDEP